MQNLEQITITILLLPALLDLVACTETAKKPHIVEDGDSL